MEVDSFDKIFGDGEGGYNEPSNNSTPPKVFTKKSKIVIAVVAVVLLVGIFVIGLVVGQNMYKGMSKDQPLMDEVYDIVSKYYIEDVTREEFQRYLAAGMVSGLDKYTGLYLKDVSTGPKYGVSYGTDDYNIKTVKNVDEGSKMFGKVMRGDKILAIDLDRSGEWTDVEHLSLDKFADMVNKSETMRMRVSRAGEIVETEHFGRTFDLHDTLAEYRDTPYAGIGYVRLKSFDNGAIDDFMSAIYDFEHSGNNVMVLDLRDNPGGSTLELSKIVNNFIEHKSKKDIVIKIENRGEGKSYTYADDYTYNDGGKKTTNEFIGNKIAKPFRLVIVANDNSASAAEAFIGNIKHYMDKDHYLLLGESERTFGKGIAQRDYNLKTDPTVALHMTIGKYYVLGEKGTARENDYTNIHGIGYELDNTGIATERKANIIEEDAIIKACKRAMIAFGDVLA